MASPQLSFGGTSVVNPYENLINVLGKNGALAQNMIAGDEAKRLEQEQAYKNEMLNMQKAEHQMRVDAAELLKQEKKANSEFYTGVTSPLQLHSGILTESVKPEMVEASAFTPQELKHIDGIDISGELSPASKDAIILKGGSPDDIAKKLKIQQSFSNVANVLPNTPSAYETTSEHTARVINETVRKGLPVTENMMKYHQDQIAADRTAAKLAQEQNTANLDKVDEKKDKIVIDWAKSLSGGSSGITVGDDGEISISGGKAGNTVQKIKLENVKTIGKELTRLNEGIDKLQVGTGDKGIKLTPEQRAEALSNGKELYTELVSTYGVDPAMATNFVLQKLQPTSDGGVFGTGWWSGTKLGNLTITPEERKMLNLSSANEAEQDAIKLSGHTTNGNPVLAEAYKTLLGKISGKEAALSTKSGQLLMSPQERRIATVQGLLERELGTLKDSKPTSSATASDVDIEKIPANAKDMFNETVNYLRTAKGYNATDAYSIATQGLSESNFDPKRSGDDGTAHGYFQWREDRADALRKFSDEKDISKIPLKTQLDFLDQELKSMKPTKKHGGYEEFASLTDPGEKSAWLSKYYEVAKGNTTWEGEAEKRAKLATKLFEAQPQQEAGDALSRAMVNGRQLVPAKEPLTKDAYSLQTLSDEADKAEQAKLKSKPVTTLLQKPSREWSEADIKAASVLPPIPKDKKNYDLVDVFSVATGNTPMIENPVKVKALKILADKAENSKINAGDVEEGLVSANSEILMMPGISKLLPKLFPTQLSKGNPTQYEVSIGPNVAPKLRPSDTVLRSPEELIAAEARRKQVMGGSRNQYAFPIGPRPIGL